MVDLVTTLFFRSDAPRSEPVVALADFLSASNATAVRIEPADDARNLLPHLDRIALVEVAFPAFRDGRGYSSARILREAGYTGELRAEGDVLTDQVPLMVRCGFDSFAPRAPIDAEAVNRAVNRFPHVYQAAADANAPVWKHRHG